MKTAESRREDAEPAGPTEPARPARPAMPARRPLPAGWRWVKLGEVCDLVNGDAYRDSDWSTNGVPIIRIQNLNDSRKPFNCWAGSLDDRVVVHTGDVLLAWSGTPGTSFGAHRWARGLGVLNQHIFRVDLDLETVDPDWAVHAINEQLHVMIGKAHGGVGLRHVTRREVDALKILLPPLSEQRRIAAILREQMAAVAEARASAEEQLEAARALPASHLRAVFAGPQAARWPRKQLGQLFRVKSGCFLPANAMNPNGKYPVYGGNGVNGSHDAFMFDEPKIVIGRVGALCGCVHISQPKAWITDNALYVSDKLEPFDDGFMAAALRYLDLNSKANTMAQPLVTGQIIYPQEIPAPPLLVQQHIAAQVSEQMADIEGLRKLLEEQLAEIEALPGALLRRAFAGEL